MTIADTTATNTAGRTDSVRESIRMWALIALVLYVISGVAFVGFTAAGGVWFVVSDSIGLLLSVALMVLVIRFDELYRHEVGGMSRIARWVGVAAMGLGIAGSIVLISSETGHEFIPGGGGLGMQFAGWGLLGIWFVLLARMNHSVRIFDRRWYRAAQVAGWGSIIAMAATIPLGPASPVVSIGFGVTFVAIIFWVIWTRSQLAS